MVSIVNYGMGNIRSVCNALRFIGVESRVVDTQEQVLESTRLILPGVGSFRAAMENIRRLKLDEALNEAVIRRGIPILGICLGMQLLAEWGEEDGLTQGLGWVRGVVRRFPAEQLHIKIPHIGFNSVTFAPGRKGFFKGLKNGTDFYFVHSYRMVCDDPADVCGWSFYGESFTAGVQHGHVFGTQFHPEKSQNNGLALLKNFCNRD